VKNNFENRNGERKRENILKPKTEIRMVSLKEREGIIFGIQGGGKGVKGRRGGG